MYFERQVKITREYEEEHPPSEKSYTHEENIHILHKYYPPFGHSNFGNHIHEANNAAVFHALKPKYDTTTKNACMCHLHFNSMPLKRQ